MKRRKDRLTKSREKNQENPRPKAKVYIGMRVASPLGWRALGRLGGTCREELQGLSGPWPWFLWDLVG